MDAWKMDMWRYYAVTHREHDLCNPLHPGKLDELLSVLRLGTGARVVDIACGKGELLFRLHERYGTRGTGVDISPYFLAEAAERKRLRAPEAELEWIEARGADWRAGSPESWDCACCIGAEWVFGGFRNTLEALAGWTRPGGWILAGCPFWRRPPEPEYLERGGLTAETFATHHANAGVGAELDLSLCYTLVADQDDWDLYQGLQWRAVDAYAREHEDDPDLAEIRGRSGRERDNYLCWERECLGWAIYAFRK